MWEERSQREGKQLYPPCDDCGVVELHKDNLVAARIYQIVRNQVRLAFNGQYSQELDLDFTAVWDTIDHCPDCVATQRNRWDVFERVVAAYHELLRDKD